MLPTKHSKKWRSKRTICRTSCTSLEIYWRNKQATTWNSRVKWSSSRSNWKPILQNLKTWWMIQVPLHKGFILWWKVKNSWVLEEKSPSSTHLILNQWSSVIRILLSQTMKRVRLSNFSAKTVTQWRWVRCARMVNWAKQWRWLRIRLGRGSRRESWSGMCLSSTWWFEWVDK